MRKWAPIVSMIALFVLALAGLVFVFGIDPKTGSFELARGLLVTTTITVISVVLSIVATALQWWGQLS